LYLIDIGGSGGGSGTVIDIVIVKSAARVTSVMLMLRCFWLRIVFCRLISSL